MSVAANLTLGFNARFANGWIQGVVAYLAYIAFRRNEVIDWKAVTGQENLYDFQYPLEVLFADHHDSIGRGMRNALDLWTGTSDFSNAAADTNYTGFRQQISPVNAVICGSNAEIAKHVAAIGSALREVEIGYLQSNDFYDRDTYPYLMRIKSEPQEFGVAIHKVVMQLGITRFGAIISEVEPHDNILLEQSDLKISVAQLPYLGDASIGVLDLSSNLAIKWRTSIRSVVSQGVRILVLLASSADAENEKILQLAYHEGFCGSQFLWLMSSMISVDHLANRDAFPVSSAFPGGGLDAFHGALVVGYWFANTDALRRLYKNLAPGDFPEPLQKNLHGNLPDESLILDSEDMVHLFNAVSLFIASSYRLLALGYESHEVRGQLLLDSASSVKFEGVGVVCHTTFCAHSFGLHNLQEKINGESVWKIVGRLFANSSKWVFTSPVIYPNGGSELVVDEATCPPGYGWGAGNFGSLAGCVRCLPGQYGRGGSLPCLPCEKGTFRLTGAQSACALAAAGYVVPNAGSANQTPCAAGSFTAKVGQVSCESCGPGRATSQLGSKLCPRCPQGKFTSSIGSESCDSCRVGMTTRLTGASSEEECVCQSGMFYSWRSGHCKECGEGLLCDSPSNEIPEIDHGFSAAVVDDKQDFDGHQVYRCVAKASCPGGEAGTCSASGYGIACAVCRQGHYWGGQACKQCSAYHKPWLDIIVPIAMVIGVAFVTFVISNSPQTSELASASDVCLALSLTINIVTTLTVVSNFRVEWQGPIEDVLTIAHYVMMPVHLFGLQCTIGNNFVLSYLFVSLMPMLPILTLALGTLSFRRGFPHWKVINAGGQIFYGCFVVIVLHALKPVILYRHPNGRYSMTHNPQTLTETDDYNQLVIIGIAQLLLYCGSYLALCGSAMIQLRTLRKNNRTRAKPEELLWRYRFLFFRFKAKYYYWGLVFLLRSALVSLVTVVRPDLPHVQIILLVILLAFFLCLHCTNWPCRNMSHNVADAVVQGFLLCFVSSCGAFRSSSYENAMDFISHILTVLFFGFFCIIGTVLLLPLKRSIQRWRSPESTSSSEEPFAGFVTELLEKPCDAVLEVPLPSSLLDMSDPTNGKSGAEEMVVGEIGFARTPSLQSRGDGTFSSAGSISQVFTDTTPASVKLSIGGAGGVDRLRVAFRSKALTSREPLLQEVFEHERKIIEMTRAVMASMLNGMLTLKCEADNAYRVEWCDQKATDMLLGMPDTKDTTVQRWISDGAESSRESMSSVECSGRGHWPRSMLRGQLVNAYLGEETRTHLFLNSLNSDSHIAHQLSTTMVKRSGERFGCELFAVRSASSGILLGMRVASGHKALLPSESTAIMSLHNGVLGSCTPLWNMYFRRNMNGKALLPQVPDQQDKMRLTKAVESLMTDGESQAVHGLCFKQHKSTSQFKASLVLTDAGVGDPSEVKLILQDISPQWRLQNSTRRSTASGSADGDDHSVISTHVVSRVSSTRARSSPGNLQSSRGTRFLHTTPKETIQLGLMELMQHFDAPAQCCAWHATAQLVQSGVLALKMKKLSCDTSWHPFSDWQCHHCKALNEFDASVNECGVCGTSRVNFVLPSDASRSTFSDVSRSSSRSVVVDHKIVVDL